MIVLICHAAFFLDGLINISARICNSLFSRLIIAIESPRLRSGTSAMRARVPIMPSKSLLLHAKFDGFYRVWWVNGIVCSFPRIYQCGQHVKTVALWCSALGTPKNLNFLQCLFIVLCGADRFGLTHDDLTISHALAILRWRQPGQNRVQPQVPRTLCGKPRFSSSSFATTKSFSWPSFSSVVKSFKIIFTVIQASAFGKKGNALPWWCSSQCQTAGRRSFAGSPKSWGNVTPRTFRYLIHSV